MTSTLSRRRSRCRESPGGFDAVHSEHEPQTNRMLPPTRCCRRLVGRAFLRFLCRQDAGSTLRFMESPLSGFFRMHWDHEPVDCAVASWTAPVLWRFWLARLHRQSARRLSSLPKKTPAGHALSILSICLIFSVSTVADARLVYPQSPQPGSLPACWAVLDV